MDTAREADEPGKQHFHAVRFYQDDATLCRIVAGFVGDALVAGQPAVIIATPPHRTCILDELRSLSVETDHLVSNGDLLLLDAEETLATFMVNGQPDPAAFLTIVGGVLERVRGLRTDVTVRAYGEMVDWLWKHDAPDAAIRLEVLWNELANTYPFSLLCGYSMGNFYKHGAYERICAQHTHVVSESGQPTRVGIDGPQ